MTSSAHFFAPKSVGRFCPTRYLRVKTQGRETDGTVQRLVLVDRGDPHLRADFLRGSRQHAGGITGPLAGWNNHRLAWEKLPQAVTQGKPFDYYPRGRVELRGTAAGCSSPRTCARRMWCCKSGEPWAGTNASHPQSGRQPALPLLLDEQEENRS